MLRSSDSPPDGFFSSLQAMPGAVYCSDNCRTINDNGSMLQRPRDYWRHFCAGGQNPECGVPNGADL